MAGAQSNLAKVLATKVLRDSTGGWAWIIDKRMIADSKIEKIVMRRTDQHEALIRTLEKRRMTIKSAMVVGTGRVEDALSLHGSRITMMARLRPTIVIVMVTDLWIEVGDGGRRNEKIGTIDYLIDLRGVIEGIDENVAIVAIEETEATVDGIETGINVKSASQSGWMNRQRKNIRPIPRKIFRDGKK